MPNYSVITLEKPMQHLGLSDWHGRLTQLRNIADEKRQNAFNIRHSSRTLRNETRIQSEWEVYKNNTLLADR